MPIGFFDSGVGGISVLKEAVKLMPEENFIYYGDSKNAPYGPKIVDEVKRLTLEAVEFLIHKGVKAVVIACNTATSAAIEELREKYKDIPIIGIEPALKPAVELRRKGKIIIMATSVTLSETKFNNLMEHFIGEAEIEPLVCGELVEFVENGVTEGNELNNYLSKKLEPFLNGDISSVVLGCTHFPFIKEELKKILKEDTPIIDGSFGTAVHLKKQLISYNIKSFNAHNGYIKIYNSSEDDRLIKLSYELLGEY